jgi:phosphoenolpyruvate-protein kinase (PTS system EI component)
MIEVPAAALAAEQLAAEVDFFSIGTNDLTQYTLAADRGNPRTARLFDPLHPAVLRLIEMAVRGGRSRGIPVAVCGDLASDPRAVPVLVELGVDELSMPVSAIATTKNQIRGLREPRQQ